MQVTLNRNGITHTNTVAGVFKATPKQEYRQVKTKNFTNIINVNLPE